MTSIRLINDGVYHILTYIVSELPSHGESYEKINLDFFASDFQTLCNFDLLVVVSLEYFGFMK